MKIQPSHWEFIAGDFCCYAFQEDVFGDGYIYSGAITTDGKKVFFKGKQIEFCPYCGKKIVLEREVK